MFLLVACTSSSQPIVIQFGSFDVPASGDVTLCRTFKLNVPAGWITKLSFDANPGVDHTDLFAATPSLAVADTFYPCGAPIDWNDFTLIAMAPAQKFDWTFPPGSGFRLFTKHPQLMMRTHFVGPAPAGGNVKVALSFTNDVLHTTDVGNIPVVIHDINIPAQRDGLVSRRCTLTQKVELVALLGYYHSHLTRFTVSKLAVLPNDGGTADGGADAAVNAPGQTLLEANDPLHIAEVFFADPRPTLAQGDALEYSCMFHNGTSQPLVYGPDPALQERCNLFVYFTTPQAGAPQCAEEGSSSW